MRIVVIDHNTNGAVSMNKNNTVRIRNILLYILFFLAILQMPACQSMEDEIIEQWKKKPIIKEQLTITYPQNSTVFPPEFISPTFTWKDTIKDVKRWFIVADNNENKQLFYSFSVKKSWKPDSLQWELLKKNSLEKGIRISISGIKNSTLISTSSVIISTSKDSVNAPIFYRDVPLPFKHALKNITTIKYRLGDISKDKKSKVMLENLPVCGNCHSFTADGKTMAMDVDYANDKGSYVISNIEEETPLTLDKIITWSDYKREDKEATFGLLSQISPDGRYVASMVKDRSVFIAKDDDIAYSQLFFPIKGVIVIYDRQTKKYFPLKGASNPKYCQSNPNWSPDGKYLIFSRAKVYRSKKIEQYKTAIIPAEAAKEFVSGEKEYKYDLYKIPFNNGKGGKAKPIKGASRNGKSNFFAKISPNGKWIVFTQAENFMLLQPDSKLMIVSTEGGNARELTYNNLNMNSWHSWAPNSKWLVFSSKERGPYTQLYLTHIDNKGNDTPPVLLENFILPNRAVNIPEFVNLKSESWEKMIDAFSDSSNYVLRAGHNNLYFGKYDEAIKAYSEAIKQTPKDYRTWYSRATAFQRAGKLLKAIDDLRIVLKLKPDFMEGEVNLADIYVQVKNYEGAEEIYNKVLIQDPKNAHVWSGLGISRSMRKQYQVSIKYFTTAIKFQPDSAEFWTNRAISYKFLNKTDLAIKDLKKALKLNKKYLLALQNLGDIYFTQNKIKEALNIYEQTIRIKKNDPVLLHKMGDSYLRLGQYQLAIGVYDLSLSIKPNVNIYLARGICKMRLNELDAAIADFNQCIQANLNDADAYFNRGYTQAKAGNFKDAIIDFTTVIKINPNNARAHYERGLLNLQMGQKNNGCTDLKKALKLGDSKSKSALAKYCY